MVLEMVVVGGPGRGPLGKWSKRRRTLGTGLIDQLLDGEDVGDVLSGHVDSRELGQSGAPAAGTTASAAPDTDDRCSHGDIQRVGFLAKTAEKCPVRQRVGRRFPHSQACMQRSNAEPNQVSTETNRQACRNSSRGTCMR